MFDFQVLFMNITNYFLLFIVNGANATKQVIIYLDEKTDWILILHNKYFDNKNSLFFSIRWLSCNTVSIKNFYKDLNKKVF